MVITLDGWRRYTSGGFIQKQPWDHYHTLQTGHPTTISDSICENYERQLQKVLEDTTTKRGLRLHRSGPTGPKGRPPGPAQSPLILCHLVLLPMIYFIDFKAVLDRFIQCGRGRSRGLMMWQFLGRYSISPYIRTPRPPLGGHLSFRSRLNTRRIRARLSNVVD
jgi:hypothetical protein